MLYKYPRNRLRSALSRLFRFLAGSRHTRAVITALSALVRGHTTPQQHATEETQNYIHKLLLRLGPSSGSCRQGASPAVTRAHDYTARRGQRKAAARATSAAAWGASHGRPRVRGASQARDGADRPASSGGGGRLGRPMGRGTGPMRHAPCGVDRDVLERARRRR